jgi:RNA polymerase sigma-70 factor, ECF subfamily
MAGGKDSAGRITKQLKDWAGGENSESANAVLTLVYDELHRQAHRYLKRERAGHTLQTTALVNEVYLKLVNQKNVVWENRSHFLAIAARLMRQILIDYARAKHRAKRGGIQNPLPEEDALTVGVSDTNFDLLALDEALTRLAAKEEHLAKIVELRFFSGLSVEDTAGVLGISASTVKRDWLMAKAWLRRELTGKKGGAQDYG